MDKRERRSNAGNLLAKVLDEEEEDEFYATTYGGFQETEEDVDYKLVHIFSILMYYIDILDDILTDILAY